MDGEWDPKLPPGKLPVLPSGILLLAAAALESGSNGSLYEVSTTVDSVSARLCPLTGSEGKTTPNIATSGTTQSQM
eukprot:scaffold49671_cov28-Prasinocladus_malaysianus.AAC.1